MMYILFIFTVLVAYFINPPKYNKPDSSPKFSDLSKNINSNKGGKK